MVEANNIKDISKVLTEELHRLAERIKENHQRAGQVASGRTLQSITYEVTDNVGILYGRFPFGTLETGRKGGRVPNGFVSIIRQWILDKGISVQPIPYKRKPSAKWQPKYTPQERGEMTIAGAIANRIRKSGTRLHREGGRNDIYSNEIPEAIERIENRISKVFSLMIDSININA